MSAAFAQMCSRQPRVSASYVHHHAWAQNGQAGQRHDWPQNLLVRGEGLLTLAKKSIKVKPRLITDPDDARAVSQLYRDKYGPFVRGSKPDQALTPAEQATFELLPA